MLAQPGDQVHQRFLVSDPVAGTPGHFIEKVPVRILDKEVRRSSQTLAEPFPDKSRLGAIEHVVYLKFEAR
jgi:hypothetical protein